MSRTRVKICGITRREDALAAIAAGADAIGLVFYEGSPRAVDLVTAAQVTEGLPAMVSIVGLFVDADAAFVDAALAALPLSVLQFHGAEDPGYCASFGMPWMKAVRVAPETDVKDAAAAYADASAILLDTFKAGVPGGTGDCFDWGRVPELPAPVVLAGGLDVGNVGEAIRSVRPYAVDVSGGVEAAPGRKSRARMEEFVGAVAAADLAASH